MLLNCLAVGCGGFMGSVLRYLIGVAFPQTSFPWTTLFINVLGSFILAVLAGFIAREVISNPHFSLMLRVGLCGGFTTMSTFSYEMMDLASRGAIVGAFCYAALTFALCLAAAFAGSYIVR